MTRRFDRSSQIRLLVSGPDRAKFLHNLTTNEVKRLKPGDGREAFVTSPQGKTLAHVRYHLGEDAVLVRADPAARDDLLAHLRKYGVFDEVEIEEITASTAEVVVWGGDFGPLGDAPQSVRREGATWILRDDPTGEGGATLVGPPEEVGRWAGEGESMSPEDFEAARIEAGTPVFGRDVTSANLPQEVGRDALAINFVKGCYLGQETVARLDALGHVNRLLVGLVSDVAIPAGGTLRRGDEEVGRTTSSAWSARRNGGVALGYVRVPKVKPGDRLTAELDGREAMVEVVPAPRAG